MRKTLIALMFAAALPTVAMAMPEGAGPMGPMDGPRHGGQMHDKGPYSQLDLTHEQRQQIRRDMGRFGNGIQRCLSGLGLFAFGNVTGHGNAQLINF